MKYMWEDAKGELNKVMKREQVEKILVWDRRDKARKFQKGKENISHYWQFK